MGGRQPTAHRQQAGRVTVAASPDGGQIYFIGGDQRLDRQALRLDSYLPKDYIVVGPVQTVACHTRKGFHQFGAD